MLDAFVAISVWLTGFTDGELRATGMAERYHATVRQHTDPAHYDRLVADLLAAHGDPAALGQGSVELARAITHLWYLGAWPGEAHTVSARAHAEGLVWKTFHGAPPGTTAPGFASWSRRPVIR
ncbi:MULTISPECIES: hypothetical protein [unclassified Crossiella]|uniref:hypothetical protein n=1 Tax=unclassified Crossiella TaxID=2620835 RepID=UPI0020001A75|nr:MULTISPECIES: hypothetical protein [unclassified Crossiella]MCK2244423.1 hypothetical protein [Crossiella sp. S99.2]MCK2257749.1 hypothetical protein [Crossiella sp. S99.1]